MQDISDENEPDLQSVFQKISESLKTINQEAIENETSENNYNDNTKSSEKVEQKQQQEITHVNIEILNKNISGVNQTKPPDKNDGNYLELEKLNGVDDLVTEETSLEVSDLLIQKEVNPIVNGEVIEESTEIETTFKNKEKSKSPSNVLLVEDCKEIQKDFQQNAEDLKIINESVEPTQDTFSEEQNKENANEENDLYLEKPNTGDAIEPDVNPPLETILENGEILSDNSKTNSLSALDNKIESKIENNSKSTNDSVCTLEKLDKNELNKNLEKENVISNDIVPMHVDTENGNEIGQNVENTNKEISEISVFESEEEKISKEVSKVSAFELEGEKKGEEISEDEILEEQKDENKLVLESTSKDEKCTSQTQHKVEDELVLDSDFEKITIRESKEDEKSKGVSDVKAENSKESENTSKDEELTLSESHKANDEFVLQSISDEVPISELSEQNYKPVLDTLSKEVTISESSEHNDNLLLENTSKDVSIIESSEEKDKIVLENDSKEQECIIPETNTKKDDFVLDSLSIDNEGGNKINNSDIELIEESPVIQKNESENEKDKADNTILGEECKELELVNIKNKSDNVIFEEECKEREFEAKKHKSDIVIVEEECKEPELENKMDEHVSDSNSIGDLVMEIDENDAEPEYTSENNKIAEETTVQKEKEDSEDESKLIEISGDEPMIIDLDSEDENIVMNKKKMGSESQHNKPDITEDAEKMEVDDDNELEVNETNNEANSENLINQTKETENEDSRKPDEIGDDSNIDGKSNDLIIDLDEEDDDANDAKPSEISEENKDSNELVGNEKVEKEAKSSDENLPNSTSINEDKEKTEEIDTEDKETFELMDVVEDSQNQVSKENIEINEKGESSNIQNTLDEPNNTEESKMENGVIETSDNNVDKDIFYNKECVNHECKKNCNIFYISPIFILNFYKITIKTNTTQFVCDVCYDAVVDKYEDWCNLLETHQPLLLTKVPQKQNEFVEILDSSDEDETSGNKNDEKPGDFDEQTIELIKNELDDAIATVFTRTEIQNQLTWSKTLLENRIAKLQEDSAWIDETLSSLQKSADKMNNALYQCPKIEMKILAPLDLNSGKQYVLGESTQAGQLTIPPIGEIFRPPVLVGFEYFAAKNKVIASWLPSRVVEIVEPPSHEKDRSMKYYKVKFSKIKLLTYKSVPAKHLAYVDVPKVQLSIGTRVIALFDASTLYKTKESQGPDIRSAFYPGVIAEALQPYNNYRYLIFFDDGYTQYVHHRDVRLICEVSTNVWDDIHPGSRDFIQNYLINYKKNRPMVQVKKGQSMITELNGKWIYAKVVDVDASLIQMLFEGQKNHTEWIYRGSTRLGPLFKAIQKTNIPQVTRLPRRSEPFVRYMQDDENCKQQNNSQQNNQQNESGQNSNQIRSQVARKSTSTTRVQESQDLSIPSAGVKHLNNSTIFVDDEEPKGTLIYYSSKSENNPPPKLFKAHACGPHCITREHFEGHYGVLSKPLLNSWERSIFKIKSKKTSVVYRAPCGRNLRSIEEVHKYLRITRNELNVENFVFDPDVGCLNEYQVKKCIVNKADITEGREKIPIQCVNYYDHTMPPDCEYSADRIPTEGVNLNVDPEYLVGCDCKDDCTDKFKCSCWKLTLEGARYGNPHTPIENIGYYYKRLLEPVTTGIYECNSRCKCSSKCINRVVQHSLETKLQVFKTSNRGWGLRCINDVPKGAFICIYAGNLLTEQKANECGDGDEYFAELDYIEVAERLKEGYESDVNEDIDSDDYIPEDRDSDEEFSSRASYNTGLVNTRNRTASAKRSNSNTTNGTNDDDDEQERQAINFVPNTQLENYEEIQPKYKSMRRLFGKNEYCYIMDAKSIGNVGRYFNHSCSPNLFVQNVFVDTHDLRFPWVAFFALSNIRAGTELTWNYNYEVGVVPGKVLFCQCGAANCRGRLL